MLPALAGVALLIGLGVLWRREHDARAREAAAARRSEDSLRTVVATERARAARQHTGDSLAAARALASSARALAAARSEADSLAGLLSPLLDSLPLVSPDLLGPFLARVEAAWKAHLAGDDAERVKTDTALAVRDARIVALELGYAADLAACGAQIDSALAQLRRANARARPGLVQRALRALPWAAGAFLVGWVVGH